MQDAMSRKYSDQSPSESQDQGYIDLLSDSDDDVSASECGHIGVAQEEQYDNSGASASSSCGLLCVPLADFHIGKGENFSTFLVASF